MEKLKKLMISIFIIISFNNVSISQTEKSLFFAGTNFQLGQDKEEVLNKINLKNFKLIKVEEDFYMIYEYNQKTGNTVLGQLYFLNGKLSSASSNWAHSSSKETYQSFESLFGILRNIFGEGYNFCEIHVSNYNNSETDIKQIEMILGDKLVNILITYIKKDSQEIVDISEKILSR